jgi:redox-sensitive bicupin YhaK (pirin superfamily)
MTGGTSPKVRGESHRDFMSAGRGIRHSEMNASKRSCPPAADLDHARLIAEPDGKDGSVIIHQDARLYVSLLSPGQQVTHELGKGHHAWLQVAKRAVELNGKPLKQGDGAAVSDEQKLVIKGVEEAEVLLFDLA